MEIRQWLTESIKLLNAENVPTAQLDAEVLLADALKVDRSWLHTHPDHSLQGQTLQSLNEQIRRRARHEPIAYIRGKQEFYGRDFIVSPDTLTPRPETETMIELLIKTMDDENLELEKELQIIDVGTGSGCIIITAVLELSKVEGRRSKIKYTGLDISEPALEIARENAVMHEVTADFKKFDLLKGTFDFMPSSSAIILANLPYVPKDFQINLAATHEPAFAIFGGTDGLDFYRILFKKVTNNTKYIFTESLPPQHNKLKDIAKATGYRQIYERGFIQVLYAN